MLEAMMLTREEFNEEVNFKEMYPADLKRLPSMDYRNFSMLVNSFSGRHEYISQMGFPLLTYEFQRELQEQLQYMEIDTFVEIEAGVGSLSVLLNNIDISGKGYTLDPDACEGNWGMDKSPVFEYARANDILRFRDIRELTLDHKPDMIVASWIPLGGGNEVIDFFENQNHDSEHFMIIGEGYGGCTASDEFHQWLDDNFDSVWTSQRYVSFAAIHDRVCIYRRKEQDGLL